MPLASSGCQNVPDIILCSCEVDDVHRQGNGSSVIYRACEEEDRTWGETDPLVVTWQYGNVPLATESSPTEAD